MIDLEALLGSWYRGVGENRFNKVDDNRQIYSPYDIPSEVLVDIIKRNVRQFKVITFDLSLGGHQEIEFPGYHIVAYGHDGSDNKAVNTSAYLSLQVNRYYKEEKGFPMKHGRGFSGIFEKTFITWPAQPGVFVDLVIHTGIYRPYIGGDAAT